MACRFLNVSTSGYYEWVSRPPSPRAVADAALTTTIRRIHADSRETSGAPRVLAELRLGLGVHVGRKRVARLMRLDGLSNWPRYHIVLVVAIADPPADVSELEESPEEEN